MESNDVVKELEEQAKASSKKPNKLNKKLFIAELYNKSEDRYRQLKAEGKTRIMLDELLLSVKEGEQQGLFRKKTTVGPKTDKQYYGEINWYLRRAADEGLCGYIYKKRGQQKKPEQVAVSGSSTVQQSVNNTHDEAMLNG